MIEVLISFAFITVICLFLGMAATDALNFFFKGKINATYFGRLVLGIIAITVFTGYLSIFTGIGALATFLVIGMILLYTIFCRKRFASYVHEIFDYILCHKWEVVFCFFVAVIIAYFTSRGNYHTDTNLYHAANIRIYEEVGLIKGMANLYNNYGYNSMYHAFAAFFSEHWLLSKPWHVTSGYLALILSIYAIHNLKSLNEGRIKLSDGGYIAILIYVLNILYYVNSPATDFAPMLFSLYMMTEWIRLSETAGDVYDYANLSVLAVYILTLKVSAGLLVVAVIYPAFILIREKKWGDIARYISMGIIVLLPYLVRNYYISGWLIYPFEGIDIFNVKWKLPVDVLRMDVDIISSCGKCLFDYPHDLPMTQWLPIWWSAQEYYGKLLVAAALLGTVTLVIHLVYTAIIGKFRWQMAAILLGDLLSMALWFTEAPFIRYGLAFLLFTPCLAIAVYFSEKRHGLRRIVMGLSAFITIFFMLPFVDHYFGDNIGFISMHRSEPYYVFQKDYDVVETTEVQVGEITVNGGDGSVNSYYAYPGTVGRFVDKRLDSLGDKLEDGFYMHE